MKPGEQRRVSVGDVSLSVRCDGDPDSGAPVVVLHGFTGSCESMAGVAAELAGERAVYRLDLLGHGRADAPADVGPYTMARCVGQIVGVLDALGLRAAHLLGYSMGARVALSLCVAHPARVRSALLVGVSPGIADARARAARVASDEALAKRIEDEGIPAFVDHWTRLPLFASQARLDAAARERARAQRLANRGHGLAGSLRGMGAGAMPPLHADLLGVALPVCLVVGAEDAKFLAIAEELRRALPDARLAVLEEAGHAAHLEQPGAFGELARRFLRDADATARSRRVSAPANDQDRRVPVVNLESRE